MTDVITKTYVINLQHRTDRWNNINKDFQDTVISSNMTRWNAVYGKDLSDKAIKDVSTFRCYHCCSPSMIGCWLSHYTLWKHIVDNKQDNVLILEDDAYPVYKGLEFNKKLVEFSKDVPEGWDMVYFGCFGTCDKSSVEQNFFQLYGGKGNKPVYKTNKMNKIDKTDGNISQHVVHPGFPLGTHAYILSYNGAKKLLDSKKFDKVDYHVDHNLAKYFVSNDNFKVYAFYPSLVKQNLDTGYSDNQVTRYPLFSKLFSNVYVSEQHSIDSFCAIQVIHLRKLGISVSILSMSIIILSFIIGILSTILSNYNIIFYYTGFIFFYYLVEMLYGFSKHCKILVVDFILSCLFLFISRYLGLCFK